MQPDPEPVEVFPYWWKALNLWLEIADQWLCHPQSGRPIRICWHSALALLPKRPGANTMRKLRAIEREALHQLSNR